MSLSSATSSSPDDWEPPSAEELQKMMPQYEVIDILGRGGMGAVYKARQESLNRVVAIKLLPESFTQGGDEFNFSARFKQEARAMAKLSHPAIVSVFGFGETSEGQLYFVMEFIDGMDIQQYLKAHGGTLPQEHALSITAQVLDALEYAHNNGIVHRDIKPANILLNNEGQVKIADFGLAKALAIGGEEEAPALTMTNMAMGTADFIAPEASDPDIIPDHRADLYAVGVMLYRMLAGTLPRGEFDLPSKLRVELDPRLDDVIAKAMYSNPDRRFSSASEMRQALEPIISSPTTRSQMVAEAAEAKIAAGSTSKKSTVIGVAMALLLVAGVVLFLMKPEKEADLPASPDVMVKVPEKVPKKANAEKKPNVLKRPGPVSKTVASATKDKPFENGLGMRFVPVPITGGPSDGKRVLFSIWETRVKDYAGFSKANKDSKWRKPASQKADHPAAAVDWESAVAFCEWLTTDERKKGKIDKDQYYRLPTDHEWSCAVGIGAKEDALSTPDKKRGKIGEIFLWGKTWPPPKGAGNYYGEEAKKNPVPWNMDLKQIEGYDDGFDRTAPVGSFLPNEYGLFDMGGNLIEWCENWYSAKHEKRVLRGACWVNSGEFGFLSSHRRSHLPSVRYDGVGFRVVVSSVPAKKTSPDSLITKSPTKVPSPDKAPDKMPEPKQSAKLAIPGLRTRIDGFLKMQRTQVGGLNTNYLRGLDARLKQAVAAKNRDLIKSFQNEKYLVETLQKSLANPPADQVLAAKDRATLPVLFNDAPKGLSELREIWAGERREIRTGLSGKLRGSLRNLEAELTRNRDFENAKAVQKFRVSLAKIDSLESEKSRAIRKRQLSASKDKPFENSLGMRFAPVPIIGGPGDGKTVLFSVWETRVKEYEAFNKANPGSEWRKPAYQEADHPAAAISWEDAVAFCKWLTDQERKKGEIGGGQQYRLPTDHEWSCAVGIGEEEDALTTPDKKSRKIADVFPWGKDWPPPKGAGNYYGEETKENPVSWIAEGKLLDDYDDGFDRTASAGSFKANRYGIFDMGGNIHEWCEDWYSDKQEKRVLRGSSWEGIGKGSLLSSHRGANPPSIRYGLGFRVVISGGSASQINPASLLTKNVTADPASTAKDPSLEKIPDKMLEPKQSSPVAIPGLKMRIDGFLQVQRTEVGQLATKYIKSLDARLKQASDVKNIELVKALQGEKSLVETLQKLLANPPADPVLAAKDRVNLPVLPKGTPEGLSKLRKIWASERRKIRANLALKLQASLKNLETELTRAKNFDSATVVQSLHRSLAKMEVLESEKLKFAPAVKFAPTITFPLPIPKRPTLAGRLEVYRRDGKAIGSQPDDNDLAILPKDMGNQVVSISVTDRGREDEASVAIALLSDGTVRLWASGIDYQGEFPVPSPTITDPGLGLTGIVQAAAGLGEAVFLDDKGQVFGAGKNFNQQYGEGTQKDSDGFKGIPFQTVGTAAAIALQSGPAYALKTDGSVVLLSLYWSTSHPPEDLPPSTALAAGGSGFALGADGNWRCWKGRKKEQSKILWTDSSNGGVQECATMGNELVWITLKGRPMSRTLSGEIHKHSIFKKNRFSQIYARSAFMALETRPGVWKVEATLPEDDSMAIEAAVKGCSSVAASAVYIFGIRPDGE